MEQALRNFSTLTQGDIIEIVYNSIVFELLIMEMKPEGPGINVLDTDLEVFHEVNFPVVIGSDSYHIIG